ncbi:GNAT family N-acetyltransferase [Clostridium tetani]|uniref:GNAT family N-acetyltransferase n=2 Tax=Clostridium tetani TaxID=1513 RepID=A0ABY0ENU4_CLOTA|nr:GNAT family N-acetyltransferase [Clostridium tetani]RXI74042.1 GNAT family N-acetyltransferase [Clostridium tetani]
MLTAFIKRLILRMDLITIKRNAMLNITNLNKNNLFHFKILNNTRLSFNSLNVDFLFSYENSGFFDKMLLRKEVFLLKDLKEYYGYLWCTKKTSYYLINSLNLKRKFMKPKYMSTLLGYLRKNSIFKYMCEDNGFNISLLKESGFYVSKCTIEMDLNLEDVVPLNNQELVKSKGIYFKTLKPNKEESIRCHIQNEVFKTDTREPLTVDDIISDENQSYYLPEGAIFVMENNEYIGYGQIILISDIPIIVNVGILKEYRGRGIGRALVYHLLDIIKELNYEEAFITVDSINKVALNLYKDCGFKFNRKIYTMELKT